MTPSSPRKLSLLVALAFASGVACGSDRGPHPDAPHKPTAHDPRVPPSTLSASVRRSLGQSPRDCGEVVAGLDNRECDVRRIFDCLKSAYDRCAPAHGVHMYTGAEGDPIRIDYFVKPEGGGCSFTVVEDLSHDPVGKKGIKQTACSEVRWKAHHSLENCEVLVPSDCRQVATAQK